MVTESYYWIVGIGLIIIMGLCIVIFGSWENAKKKNRYGYFRIDQKIKFERIFYIARWSPSTEEWKSTIEGKYYFIAAYYQNFKFEGRQFVKRLFTIQDIKCGHEVTCSYTLYELE